MKFVLKMFVLVGMILVGKFLKEDEAATNATVKKENVTIGDVYSLRSESPAPFTRQIKNVEESENLEENTTEKTFTYSLN